MSFTGESEKSLFAVFQVRLLPTVTALSAAKAIAWRFSIAISAVTYSSTILPPQLFAQFLYVAAGSRQMHAPSRLSGRPHVRFLSPSPRSLPHVTPQPPSQRWAWQDSSCLVVCVVAPWRKCCMKSNRRLVVCSTSASQVNGRTPSRGMLRTSEHRSQDRTDEAALRSRHVEERRCSQGGRQGCAMQSQIGRNRA